MYQLTTEEKKAGRFTRHQILSDGEPMRFSDVLDAWQTDSEFREFHTAVLADSAFEGFRWETPALTSDTATFIYEFVLVNSPGFCKRRTDDRTFRRQFREAGEDSVIAFANLSGDATMVVPVPQGPVEAYGHLAAFIRNAPGSQVDQMWQLVGKIVKEKLGSKPIWLNTAGGGVAWLHVRLDSRPKYYNYSPYKARPSV